MQKEPGTYLDLCTQVYDLSKPNPAPDAYAFYRSYASEVEGPILEPMCGTGRFLLPLIEDGFDVFGFDASNHMLQALREKAKARNLEPKVWRGFIEDLNRPHNFALVLIPSGSFGLMVDQTIARKALVRIYDCLRDDGVLVFEADTPRAASVQPGIWRATAWQRNDGKTIIANFLELPLQDDVSTTIWRYELTDNTQILKAEIELIRVRRYDPIQLTSLLKESGFRSVVVRRVFDRNASPQKSDEAVVYECRK